MLPFVIAVFRTYDLMKLLMNAVAVEFSASVWNVGSSQIVNDVHISDSSV